MTRVCIVGNSHVAALRNGSARIAAEFPDIEATFFGVPGRWLRSVKLVRGHNGTPSSLAPADPEHRAFFRKMSGGQDRINVADYDCFILVGLELSIFHWLSFYYQMRHEPFSFEVGAPQILDADTFADCRGRIFEGTAGSTVFKGLQEVGATSISLCPQPMPVSSILNEQKSWQILFQHEDVDLVESAFREDLLRGFPEAARVFWQPDLTRSGPLLTDPRYSKWYCGEGMPQTGRQGDHQHMNADYGAETLRAIYSELAGCFDLLMPPLDPQESDPSQGAAHMLPTKSVAFASVAG